MDAAEGEAGMKLANRLGDSLAEAARQQKALFSDLASKAQDELTRSISSKETNDDSTAVAPQGGVKATAPAARFGKSIVLIDSASAINLATPTSSLIYSGESMQWTTQSDAHCTAGNTYSTGSSEATSLYTHEGAVNVVAAQGAVSVQAHTDQVEILADRELEVVSTNDTIEVQAKNKIVLQAQQSSITLDGGDIIFACSGNFSTKAAAHNFDRGESFNATLSKLPDSRVELNDEGFVIRDIDTGEPLAGLLYRIRRADGSYEEGSTDANGCTHVVKSPDIEELTLELFSITPRPFRR